MRATTTRRVQKESARKQEIDKGPIREAVARRDGKFCLLCGDPRGLHLHRVRYASEGGKYEPTNCVLLCERHHNAPGSGVHADKKVWQPLLLDHLAGVDGATSALRRQLRRRQ